MSPDRHKQLVNAIIYSFKQDHDIELNRDLAESLVKVWDINSQLARNLECEIARQIKGK